MCTDVGNNVAYAVCTLGPVSCCNTSVIANFRGPLLQLVYNKKQHLWEQCSLQGNIVEWKKKEGDELASGDILCMVETDKVKSDGNRLAA